MKFVLFTCLVVVLIACSQVAHAGHGKAKHGGHHNKHGAPSVKPRLQANGGVALPTNPNLTPSLPYNGPPNLCLPATSVSSADNKFALTGPTGTATSIPTLNEPLGITVDPVTLKIFIADQYNCRILRYDKSQLFVDNGAPEFVFGNTLTEAACEANFVSSTVNGTNSTVTFTSASTLSPTALYVDHQGRLFAGDQYGNRILRWDGAGSLQTSSPPANWVYGQPDFSQYASHSDNSGIYCPTDVALRSDDVLFVADYFNNRIVWWKDASTKPFGAPIDGFVAGGTSSCDVLNSFQWAAAGFGRLALGAGSSLWVNDGTNGRVLHYTDPLRSNNVDLVLGQAYCSNNNSDYYIQNPSGLFYDKVSDTLFVADYGHDRVLFYFRVSNKTNNSQPDYEYGQNTFSVQPVAAPVPYQDYGYGHPDPNQNGVFYPAIGSVYYDRAATGSFFLVDQMTNTFYRFCPHPATK